jgi:hypothetical protein
MHLRATPPCAAPPKEVTTVTRNQPPANVPSSTLTRHAIDRSLYHNDPNNSPEDRMVLRYVSRGLDKQTDDVVRLLPSDNKHEVSIK